jgi:hypothetical protein
LPAVERSWSGFDKSAFDALTSTAPGESAMRSSPLVFTLPLPDGTFERFAIANSPIIAPELAAAYPQIRTFTGQGLDDPTATARFGWTQAGFHAIVVSRAGTAYIDPVAPDDLEFYLVASKDSRQQPQVPFVCLLDGSGGEVGQRTVNTFPISHGDSLRTYRLALAVTGEYTVAAGGTKDAAFARMVATMNRVNGIYERELAVRMTLIAGTMTLIHTDAASDPYNNLNDSDMLDQNQTSIDTLIGPAGYDIGHVFGTGGGGIAQLNSPCGSSKARGTTGLPNPTGDAFDVDFVSHEIGHQFGGNHTFNGLAGSCGTRSTNHAFEVGSGSTIQAYAGICGVENLQRNSNDYFTFESLNEMTAFITNASTGGSCAASAATGNTLPTVSTTAAYTIPASTPFTLTASGADGNGDAITYAWEQYDLGTASNSVISASTDAGNRPLFRSYSPSTSPSRTFPSLTYILNNGNVPPTTYGCVGGGTCLTGEVLPSTNRTMKFHVTVRDNRAGGGAIITAPTTLTVDAASGPFQITSPNSAVALTGGTAHTVTWNAANTASAPVNAANVRILLSTDGGTTFATELLSSTPNDGTQAVTLPNITTTTARIKVEAVGNVFFDISNTNFSISATQQFTATLTGAQEVPAVSTSATGSGSVTLNTAEDQITVNMSFSGLSGAPTAAHIHGSAPAGSTAGVLFDLSDVIPAATSGAISVKTFPITAPQVVDLKAGLFYFNIHTVANGGGEIRGQITGATAPGAPTSVVGTRGNGAVSVAFTAPASNGGTNITGYTVTASPGGATQTGTGSPIVVTGLTNGTAYTFTVTATNSVGTGPASAASTAVTPATVPGAPTAVTGTPGNGAVTVNFTAPASNGGSAITGYTVTASPGGATGTGTGTSIPVTGLTNGTAYTFTVTATNAVGTSAASSASAALTPATVPGAPTGVAGTAGNAQVSVAFSAPASNGGATISGYTVTASPGGATGTGGGSPIVVSGLTNGTAYTFTVTATNSAGTGAASAASAAVTPAPPSITGSPSTVTFSATKNGAGGAIVTVTAAQTITVSFVGPTAAWTAVSNQPWLQIGSGSGTGAGTFTAAIVDPSNTIGGSTALAATITLSAPSLSLTSTIAVALNVTSAATTAAPFGSFDSPSAGANVEGSIPVTGWALDDLEVARVEIWRDVVGSEPPSSVTPGLTFGKVFIANSFFVSGARPDIETTYAAYPLAHRAGWGYLLMTQGLPNQGNGTFTLYAFAFDREGRSTALGSKTITGNNALAVKPFGALDVPAYGETKSGTFYTFGWALTPNPNTTDPRTCTIVNGNVFIGIDSRPLVAVDYGDARSDIAGFFPGFSNTAGPSGAYLLDTSTLSNGTHQIGWFVVDNCGRSEGMGSRFFTVLNGGSDTVPTGESARAGHAARAVTGVSDSPIEVRRGAVTAQVHPGVSGSRVVAVGQQERVEVLLPNGGAARYEGYQVVNGDRRALPIGSTFDGAEGTFFWQPGAGFLGGHDLEFVDAAGSLVRVRFVVGTAVHAAIDAPQPGRVESSFVVAGWAIDEAAASGTGINTVHVWAFPAAGGAPVFLGAAAYGDTRPDIGALFGDQFANASFSLPVENLPAGTYDIVAYPRSTVAGDFQGAKVVRVTVP